MTSSGGKSEQMIKRGAVEAPTARHAATSNRPGTMTAKGRGKIFMSRSRGGLREYGPVAYRFVHNRPSDARHWKAGSWHDVDDDARVAGEARRPVVGNGEDDVHRAGAGRHHPRRGHDEPGL